MCYPRSERLQCSDRTIEVSSAPHWRVICRSEEEDEETEADTGSDVKMASSGTRCVTRWLSAAASSTHRSCRVLIVSGTHSAACSVTPVQTPRGGIAACLSSWTHRNVVTLTGVTGEIAKQLLA